MRTRDDQLVVHGGAGGVAVNLDELGDLAAALEEAERRLAGAAAFLDRARVDLAVGAGLAPGTAAAADTALRRARARLDGAAAGARTLADGVRQARARFEVAESRVRDRLLRVATGSAPGAPFVGLPFGAVPRPFSAPDRALLPVALAASALPGATTDVRLTKLAGAPPLAGGPPGGLGDLMRRIDALYPASGGPAGAVGVQLVEAPDGARSWVVLVPGTQTLALGGANPFDDASNVQAYTGLPTAAGAAVLGALRLAGVRADEPVLLAGHSQGGMTVMRLAANAAVRRRYRIGAVVTAGSPVGRMPAPSGVAVLHLEHSGDPITVLDAAPPPDAADRTTVRRRTAPGTAAHDIRSYAGTGDLVDASAHPSLAHWRDRAASILGGPGSTARSAVYVARRRP